MDLMTKYKNIYEGVSADHLQDEMGKIATTTVADIINIGRWKSSDETIRLESQADQIQHGIMSGKGKLIDFTEAVMRWKNAGIK